MTTAAETLAKEFATLLELMVTPAEWRQVLSTNATPDYSGDDICASHDVCDANMVMLEAFQNIMGREPELGEETPSSVADHALWNAAWSIAKPLYLTAKES